jgi:hypothetical protein
MHGGDLRYHISIRKRFTEKQTSFLMYIADL